MIDSPTQMSVTDQAQNDKTTNEAYSRWSRLDSDPYMWSICMMGFLCFFFLGFFGLIEPALSILVWPAHSEVVVSICWFLLLARVSTSMLFVAIYSLPLTDLHFSVYWKAVHQAYLLTSLASLGLLAVILFSPFETGTLIVFSDDGITFCLLVIVGVPGFSFLQYVAWNGIDLGLGYKFNQFKEFLERWKRQKALKCMMKVLNSDPPTQDQDLDIGKVYLKAFPKTRTAKQLTQLDVWMLELYCSDVYKRLIVSSFSDAGEEKSELSAGCTEQKPDCSEVYDNQDLNCVICQEDVGIDEVILWLPTCGHAFHRKCAWTRLVVENKCPACQQPVDLRQIMLTNENSQKN